MVREMDLVMFLAMGLVSLLGMSLVLLLDMYFVMCDGHMHTQRGQRNQVD